MTLARFATANRRRATVAAAHTIPAVQDALRLLGPEIPAHLAEAARLRIAHPDASLAELAAMTEDLTKDMLRGHLRTLLHRAERARRGLRLDSGGVRAGAGGKPGVRRTRRPVRSAGPLSAAELARLRRDVGLEA